MNKSLTLAFWLVTGSCAWAADMSTAQPPAAQLPNGWQSTASPATATTSQPAPLNSGSTPTAKAPSGNDPLPPPQSAMYKRAVESEMPLTPEEVRQFLAERNNVDKAMSSPQLAVVPKISALTVDLSPGASLPLIRTAVNYPSSISFIDSTGAPWNLGAAPIAGNSQGFTLYWVPKSPVMVVYANKPYESGIITVYLEGLAVPIVVTVSSGEPDTTAKTWAVDSRLDLRVPRRGPNALAGAAPESRIGLHDSTLQAFLDGVPPKEARRLKTTGDVPETSVWQMGDDLYVRSRADIRDEFEATLSSADGTHLWKLPVTPYVSFSVMGRTSALNVALE
ncbi:DotH/IcmK family type IV secretion protein [Pseudomonas cichorii]|nr:DotH/IcmK family type IV secretion protein [Pseudomonas cichorii]MBX8493181.1 DotH/IcmK family type IV secretion protein [Pseudomonas cichorii]